jgi:hypothetical protein
MIRLSGRLAPSLTVLFFRASVILLLLLLGREDSGMLQASQPIEHLFNEADHLPFLRSAPPLAHGHSHNDYLRRRPLLDALQAGFGSLEIDVFVHRETLIVSHLPRGLGRKPKLESLYLLPLLEQVRVNGGRIYAGDTSALTLMIDFKSPAEETLNTLLRVMGGYPELFLREHGLSPPVRVVISGSRPDPEMLKDQPYAIKLDGRLENLGAEYRANYPWVSASWHGLFGRRRVDQLSAQERSQLMTWCSKAQESGQQLRFWATPEDPELWEDLLSLGVYRINTDRPKRFKTFWESRTLLVP